MDLETILPLPLVFLHFTQYTQLIPCLYCFATSLSGFFCCFPLPIVLVPLRYGFLGTSSCFFTLILCRTSSTFVEIYSFQFCHGGTSFGRRAWISTLDFDLDSGGPLARQISAINKTTHLKPLGTACISGYRPTSSEVNGETPKVQSYIKETILQNLHYSLFLDLLTATEVSF